MNPRRALGRLLDAVEANRGRVLVLLAILLAAGLVAASVGYVLTSFTPAAQQRVGTDDGELSRLDSDQDGLPDIEENYRWGTDLLRGDTDGDGLPDGWEANHAREDPITGLRCPDPLIFDAGDDCDDDTLTNLEEHQVGTHPARADTDGDGLRDGFEVEGGLDPLDPGDGAGDLDGDGLTNREEHDLGTRPDLLDSDGDGLTDPQELDGNATLLGQRLSFEPTDPAAASTGGSGLPDGWLLYFDLPLDDPNVGFRDTDGDGFTNLEEHAYSVGLLGSDASVTDLLRSGLDPTDPDTDGDGMHDGWEARHGLDPTDPADGAGDPDGDGLTNREEFPHRSDPFNADTDGDGLPDGIEVAGWTVEINGQQVDVTSDPTRVDTDGDGIADADEREGKALLDGTPVTFPPTNPSSKDTDGDGLADGDEVRYPLPPPHRLDPTRTDTDDDGLSDFEEDRSWQRWRDEQAAAQREDPRALDWIKAAYPDAHGDEADALLPDLFLPWEDLDGDGVPNIVDPDADEDDLADGDEVDPSGGDGPALPPTKPYDPDTDRDGLLDGWEATYARFEAACGCFNLDPTREDSDGDGTPDGREDFDDDGLTSPVTFVFTNALEQQAGTNPLKADSDGDGLRDGWEWYFSRVHERVLPIDPLVPDDPEPTDSLPYDRFASVPGDAASTGDEAAALVSLDEDRHETTARAWGPEEHPGGDVWIVKVEGVLDLTLVLHQEAGTDPTHPAGDTDGDGLPDAWEVLRRTDPLVDDAAGDLDGDGLPNRAEHTHGTDPRSPDTDLGGTDDGREIEFAVGGSIAISPVDPSDDAPDVDLDGDGVTTRAELCIGAGDACVPTNPLDLDTDGDGLLDGPNVELDVTRPADEELARTMLQRGIVWLAVGSDTLRFYGEQSVGTDPTLQDTDEDGMPDGWEAHYGRVVGGLPDPTSFSRDQASDGDQLGDLQEYTLGRPGGWDEELDGPWWLGSDPTRTDSDGDGVDDGPPDRARDLPDLDYDLDNDGLDDLDGSDPNPLTDHANDGSPLLGDMRRVWTWLDHPTLDALHTHLGDPGTPRRVDTPQLDADGDGVPDRTDRARVRVVVDAVDPEDRAWVGEVLTVTGTVVVDEATADEGEGVPGVTVLVNLGPRSAAAEDVACAAVTDATGAFEASCRLAPRRSLSLPSAEQVLLGQAGGTVSWTYVPFEDPVADLGSRTITVWTYPTLQGTQDPIAREDGSTATAASGAEASGDDLILGSRSRIVFPSRLTALNGGNFTASGTLLDGADRPLAGYNLTLAWEGAETDVTTGPTGGFSLTLDAPTLPAPATRPLAASFPGAGNLLDTSNATEVHVRFPSTLTLDDPPVPTAGRDLVVTGRLATPSGDPVGGATVTANLAGGEADARTDPDGSFRVDLPVPPDARPGGTVLEVSTEGTDAYAGTSAEVTVNVRRPVTVRVDPLAPATYYEDYTISGVVVDDQGDPVRSLAGEPVTVAITWPPFYRGLEDVNAGSGRAGGFSHDVPGPALSRKGNVTVGVSFLGTPFYAPAESRVTVHIDVPTGLHLPARDVAAGRPFELAGWLRGANGDPVANATVDLRVGGAPAGTVTTDEGGNFTLVHEVPANYPLGPLTVEARADAPAPYQDVRTTSLWSVVAATEIVLPARNVTGANAWINGTLQDGAGRPLADLPLEVSWRGEPLAIARTGDDGGFSVRKDLAPDVTPGPAKVTVRFDGVTGRYLATETTREFVVVAQGNVSVTRLDGVVLGESFHVEGRLVSETGAPVTGPDVQLTLGDRALGEEEVLFGRWSFDGVVHDLPPGTTTLRVEFPGSDFLRPSTVEVPVTVKQRARLEVVDLPTTLGPGSEARGVLRLVNQDGEPIGNGTILVRVGDEGLPFTIRTDDRGEASFPIHVSGTTSSLGVSARYVGEGPYTAAQTESLVSVQAATVAQGLQVGGLALALLALVGVLLVAAAAWRRRQAVGEATRILEDLREDILAGNEYVASVLLAYQRLVENARRYGIHEGEAETVREFGRTLRRQVPVEEPALDALLTLFEEARYSGHEVGPAERDRASDLLRRVLREIDADAAPPGGTSHA